MLAGHGVQIAVQTVDDQHADVALFYGFSNFVGKFPRRKLGGIRLATR